MIFSRERCQWIALWMGIICLFFIQHGISGDGWTRAQAIQHLVALRHIDAMKYSLIGPLFALPLAFVDSIFQFDPGSLRYFNFICFSLGLFGLWRLLKPILDPAELRIFLLLLVCGSTFAYSTKDFYGETFCAVAIGLGSLLLVRGREIWAGLLLALGAASAPALLFPLLLLLGVRCLEKRSFKSIWILALAAALLFIDRWLRFGNFSQSGYEEDLIFQTYLPFSGVRGFSYPFILGILSILFSFGKGIFIFFPGLWLCFSARLQGERRRLAVYWLILAAGLVMVYAKWCSWNGAWYWGPRFFLFCSLPASYFLAIFLNSIRVDSTPLKKAWLALFLVGAAFWVCISGLLFGQAGLGICTQNNYALESACWYIPEFSPVFRPLVMRQEIIEPLGILIPCWIFAFLAISTPSLLLVWRDIPRIWRRLAGYFRSSPS